MAVYTFFFPGFGMLARNLTGCLLGICSEFALSSLGIFRVAKTMFGQTLVLSEGHQLFLSFSSVSGL